jgi:hypothetical protein
MRTPAHLIMGAAVFGRPDARFVTGMAIFGGLFTDLSLYLMSMWHIFILETPAREVFRDLYYSDMWQQIFAVDNSFILWGTALVISIGHRVAWAIAFTGSAFIHIFTDFLLHHDDARRHFWPISDWVFHSPVSYYDRDHHGELFGMIEIGIVVVLTAMLVRRFPSWVAKIGFILLALTEVAPWFIFRWGWIFGLNGGG